MRTRANSNAVVNSSLLNANQNAFGTALVQATGLDPGVVAAWLLSEERASSTAAPNGANNWLNIGDTGSGNYGGSASVWSNPTSAGKFTGQWLSGVSLPGYGPPSQGVQNILASAGQSPANQIAAIQNSGWAASGYPNLPSVYQEITGAPPGTATNVTSQSGSGYGGTRPGGQPVNPNGSDDGSTVQDVFTAYEQELNTPRTAPSNGFVSLSSAGWMAPFQWWWQSFTSNWQQEQET